MEAAAVSASESAAAAARAGDRADQAGLPELGRPKIREPLRRDRGCAPAISTVHAVLDRHGLVTRRRRRRYRAEGTALSWPTQPNDLWCADYKGEFMLANRRYCYPLTITDFATRYLIACDALSTTQEIYAFTAFERAFQDFGVPRALRTDNGVPFASPNALYGLSRLSVWWLRLGITLERIRPGHPEQNGRHERMHLTLKKEATKPAVANVLQQQARFDAFQTCYNRERPHQALGMKVPGELYTPSPRPVPWVADARLSLPRLDGHRDQLRSDLLQAAEGEPESGLRRPGGRRPAGPGARLARDLHALRLGLLRRRDLSAGADRESLRPDSVTYVSGMNRHPCVRNGPGGNGGGSGIRTHGTVSRTAVFKTAAINRSAIPPQRTSIAPASRYAISDGARAGRGRASATRGRADSSRPSVASADGRLLPGNRAGSIGPQITT